MTATLSGAERDRRIAYNVLGGVLARFASLLLMFFSTRLMLELLGAESLGVWLVILGVLQWVTFFDLGISQGARNEIARCMALGDTAGAARAVTTAYFYCGRVALVIGAVAALFLFSPLNDWLTARVFAGRDMGSTLALCLLAFLASFVIGFVQQVYAALERAVAAALYGLMVNLIFVVLLLILKGFDKVGIAAVAAAYCVAMLLPNVLLSLHLYARQPGLRPATALPEPGQRPRILDVGLPLFVIQIAALVIFSTDRLIVSIVVGPQAVVVYDAAFKVFTVLTMVHGIVMGVLWSSFTHAYTLSDWVWIRKTLRRLELLMLPLAAACAVLALLAPTFIRLWLGSPAVGSGLLYMGFAVFAVLSCWSNIYSHFLNGIGNVRVQMVSAICAAAVNIPVSLYLARELRLGEAGVIWGTVVSLCFFSVIGPLQTARLLRNENSQAGT